MGDLNGKVAIVTGASKGIGAAIAKAMSAVGAAVVVNYIRRAEITPTAWSPTLQQKAAKPLR
jgi:NAD(P)-dependent dehydrogenase (short-subunit alcohol dehydrogenase family)